MLDHTDVTIMGTNFLKGTGHPDVKKFSISHNKQFAGGSYGSDFYYSKKCAEFSANLWKANILDTELAFAIVLHFAKKSKIVARNIYRNSLFQSFSGFLPDIAKS